MVAATDVDTRVRSIEEPAISPNEVAYLMAALTRVSRAGANRCQRDCGVCGHCPVISSGETDPSHESRDAALWDEDGLLTVTGGKLTAFRESAAMALDAIRMHIPGILPAIRRCAAGSHKPLDVDSAHLPPGQRRRLTGRYGGISGAGRGGAPGELAAIPDAPCCRPRCAGPRAVRACCISTICCCVGCGWDLLLPEGGAAHLAAIRAICQPSWAGMAPAGGRKKNDTARCGRHTIVCPTRRYA